MTHMLFISIEDLMVACTLGWWLLVEIACRTVELDVLKSIEIRYGNLGNEGDKYRARLTVSNGGQEVFDAAGEDVTISTCFIR